MFLENEEVFSTWTYNFFCCMFVFGLGFFRGGAGKKRVFLGDFGVCLLVCFWFRLFQEGPGIF